jgi:hypothetical protein
VERDDLAYVLSEQCPHPTLDAIENAEQTDSSDTKLSPKTYIISEKRVSARKIPI